MLSLQKCYCQVCMQLLGAIRVSKADVAIQCSRNSQQSVSRWRQIEDSQVQPLKASSPPNWAAGGLWYLTSQLGHGELRLPDLCCHVPPSLLLLLQMPSLHVTATAAAAAATTTAITRTMVSNTTACASQQAAT